eukprot:7924288-Alexandrium_andersonii.AAC.1
MQTNAIPRGLIQVHAYLCKNHAHACKLIACAGSCVRARARAWVHLLVCCVCDCVCGNACVWKQRRNTCPATLGRALASGGFKMRTRQQRVKAIGSGFGARASARVRMHALASL